MANEHQKDFHIIINGTKHDVPGPEATFEQIVRLAFSDSNPNTAYTMTYSRGPKENREGSMSPGDKVFVKNEMVFNVTPTNKS